MASRTLTPGRLGFGVEKRQRLTEDGYGVDGAQDHDELARAAAPSSSAASASSHTSSLLSSSWTVSSPPPAHHHNLPHPHLHLDGHAHATEATFTPLSMATSDAEAERDSGDEHQKRCDDDAAMKIAGKKRQGLDLGRDQEEPGGFVALAHGSDGLLEKDQTTTPFFIGDDESTLQGGGRTGQPPSGTGPAHQSRLSGCRPIAPAQGGAEATGGATATLRPTGGPLCAEDHQHGRSTGPKIVGGTPASTGNSGVDKGAANTADATTLGNNSCLLPRNDFFNSNIVNSRLADSNYSFTAPSQQRHTQYLQQRAASQAPNQSRPKPSALSLFHDPLIITKTRSGQPRSSGLATGLARPGLDTSPVIISPTARNLQRSKFVVATTASSSSFSSFASCSLTSRSPSPFELIRLLEEQEEKTNSLSLPTTSATASAPQPATTTNSPVRTASSDSFSLNNNNHTTTATNTLSRTTSTSSGSISINSGSDARLPRTIVRTTSSSSVALRHPAPDTLPLARARSESVRRLEASAERLSSLSRGRDIDAPIREELRRSASGKSAGGKIQRPAEEKEEAGDTGARKIVVEETTITTAPPPANMTAAGPSGTDQPLRLPSFSTSPSGVGGSGGGGFSSDFEAFLSMSRHGPGKSSVRSARSAGKLSLAEVAELEPTTLAQAVALDDEADAARAANAALSGSSVDEDDDTIRVAPPQTMHFSGFDDEFAHDDNGYYNNDSSGSSEGGRVAPVEHRPAVMDGAALGSPAIPELQLGERAGALQAEYEQQLMRRQHEEEQQQQQQQQQQQRVVRARRSVRFDMAADVSAPQQQQEHSNAFGDFDGVHCAEPDGAGAAEVDDLAAHPSSSSAAAAAGPSSSSSAFPPADPPTRPPMLLRPKSFYDSDSGQNMLYYPARVPMMLNLPQKLSRGKEKNNRRSQLMGGGALSMPHPAAAARDRGQGKPWLPDPLEGLGDAFAPLSLGDDVVGDKDEPTGRPEIRAVGGDEEPNDAELQQQQQQQQQQRQSRTSRNLEHLPPQLRASAFFDLAPVQGLPRVEVKDGSAMSTLDSILDASAKAPVSAFTDHAFAGRLGAEIYGKEKKHHRRQSTAVALKDGRDTGKGKGKEKAVDDDEMAQEKRPVSAAGPLEPRARMSFLALGRRAVVDGQDARRNTMGGGGAMSEQGASKKGSDDDGSDAAGSDDARSDAAADDGFGSDGEQFSGQPTTLLAELQLRKQAQRLRTRVHAHQPGGLHNTLLQMDSVAEVYRKHRQGKRVNLAWEDPSDPLRARDGRMGDDADDDADEDVPLGVILQAKAAAAEADRPLGLVQRREMEDNEPLSRRRDRLQGRDPDAHERERLAALAERRAAEEAARLAAARDARDDEVQGESLAERARRLRDRDVAENNGLPRARPVSGAFSAELLSQFGDFEEERGRGEQREAEAGGKGKGARRNGKGKGKEVAPPSPPAAATAGEKATTTTSTSTVAGGQDAEEGETLGQRRRRLQAEKAAREQEMALGGGGGGSPTKLPNATNHGSTLRVVSHDSEPKRSPPAAAAAPLLTRRRSLADVLTAHPVLAGTAGGAPPDQTAAAAVAAAQQARDSDERLRAYRAQMPTALPVVGGPPRAGGFRGGVYNDGMAGTGTVRQVSGQAVGTGMGVGVLHQQQQHAQMQMQMQHQSMMAFPQPAMQPPQPLLAFPPQVYQQQQQALYPAGGPGMYGGAPTAMLPGATYPQQQQQQQQFPQFAAAAGPSTAMPIQMQMAGNMGMGMGMQMQMQMPLSQGQMDRVERWRQGVMQ